MIDTMKQLIEKTYSTMDKSLAILTDFLGFRLTPTRSLDFTKCPKHPVEISYVNARKSVRLGVETNKLRCLGSNAFSGDINSRHPFIDSLMEYNKGNSDYKESSMKKFYDRWTPDSAATFLGLQSNNTSENIKQLSPLSAVFPWEYLSPDEKEFENTKIIKSQKLKALFRGDRPCSHWNCAGPASHLSGQTELNRLIYVFDVIKNNGYARNNRADGDICGIVLVDSDQWCVIVKNGQHRAASLCALSYDKVPVRLFFKKPSIIRREDATYWPHVVSGLFTVQEALHIFDRIMDARQPWDAN